MTHTCVGKLIIIGSDNGLSPGRRQAIIRTNAGISLIGPLGTNVSDILIGIQTFSFKKMHLKMSSVKCRPFCFGLNVLKESESQYRQGSSRCFPLVWQWTCLGQIVLALYLQVEMSIHKIYWTQLKRVHWVKFPFSPYNTNNTFTLIFYFTVTLKLTKIGVTSNVVCAYELSGKVFCFLVPHSHAVKCDKTSCRTGQSHDMKRQCNHVSVVVCVQEIPSEKPITFNNKRTEKVTRSHVPARIECFGYVKCKV